MNNKYKKSHITQKQKELLIRFIEEHPQMNSGRFSESYTKATARSLWISLTNLLNAIPGAPAKEWMQWRKVSNKYISNVPRCFYSIIRS